MSIETWSVVYCDDCGDPAGMKKGHAGEAWVQAKRMGWQRALVPAQQVKGKYQPGHFEYFCPQCWEKRGANEPNQ